MVVPDRTFFSVRARKILELDSLMFGLDSINRSFVGYMKNMRNSKAICPRNENYFMKLCQLHTNFSYCGGESLCLILILMVLSYRSVMRLIN